MSKETNEQRVRAFQQDIMDWWHTNARDLPWRRNNSPYVVLVSEIMLQQTQVNRVIPKFKKFVQKFPSIEDLANAKTKQVMQVWNGLGYNRRAIWLRDAAKKIVDKGVFPRTIEELIELKGIGPYTSRSILIFAFNEDLAAVDTNIRRVFISAGFATEESSKQEVQDMADRLLLKGQAQDWHNALMDYGSKVLTSNSTGISPRTKQSKFEGSTRQLRGEIVRILTYSEPLEVGELISEMDMDAPEQVEIMTTLHNLEKDQLVEQTNTGRYRLPR
ncbi:MAG: Fe-S cluster assembly protein HesB [Candidatus Thorarchaeota archaeon]